LPPAKGFCRRNNGTSEKTGKAAILFQIARFCTVLSSPFCLQRVREKSASVLEVPLLLVHWKMKRMPAAEPACLGSSIHIIGKNLIKQEIS
jgi:hypothetical protein